MQKESLTKTGTVEFSYIEASLKKNYQLLMSNPEKFKLEAEVIQSIKELSPQAKRAGWKVVKENVQQTLGKQNAEELAYEIIIEDGVKIVSKRSLELFLKHPENAEYGLLKETIEHIKNLNSDEKSDLKDALKHDLHIGDSGLTSIKGIILDSFHVIWSKLAPIFSKIVVTLVNLAADFTEKAIESHFTGEIGKEIGENLNHMIKDFGNQLAESIEKNAEEADLQEINLSTSISLVVNEPVQSVITSLQLTNLEGDHQLELSGNNEIEH
jgi:hypothetical protein